MSRLDLKQPNRRLRRLRRLRWFLMYVLVGMMSLSVPLAAWSQYTSHGHTAERLHSSDHGTLAHAAAAESGANHGHTHQATETSANFSGHDHGHNPFDHSHETQHPPPDLTIKYLTAVHPWDNGINTRQPLGSVERVERPPRSRLQF